MSISTKGNINFFKLIQDAFKLFQKNDPLRLAAATSFFTTFALPLILIILIRLFGLFIDRSVLISNIFERLSNILDTSSIHQIEEILKNIKQLNQNIYATSFSFIFFLFVATTCFSVIKNSLDQIWTIGKRDKNGILFTLKLRVRSMIIILLAGILFFVGLLADSILSVIGNYLIATAPTFAKFLIIALKQILFIGIVTTWFTVLFRFLTNGRPKWQAAFAGGLLTGILFTVGKFILRILLPLSNIGNIYGASGSIVLIMLFVFYSAFIFYFGGCFVKVYSIKRNIPIKPINGTFAYEIKEAVIEQATA